MLNTSQLIQHLQLIQQEECAALKQYIKRQVPARKVYLNRLLTCLLKYHPDYTLSEKEENKLCQKLIPGKRYDLTRKKLNRWCNELLPFVKDFLIQSYIKTHPSEKENLLRKIYLDKQNESLYQKKLLTQLSKLSANSAEYHQILYETNEEQLAAVHTEGYEDKLPLIPRTINHLEESFAWKRIRYHLEELNRADIFNDDHLDKYPKLNESAWNYLEQLYNEENSLLQCYLLVRDALIEQQDKHSAFFKAKRYLLQHRSFFNPIDTNILLRQLLNICSRKLKAGYLDYLEQSFFLYQLGLEDEVFLYQSKLPLRLYLNIAATGDAIPDFEWVCAFLRLYEDRLTGAYKNVAIDLAWAGHYFNKGYLNQSTQLLLKSENRLPKNHQLPLWFSLRRYSINIRLQFELFSLDYYDCDKIDVAINRFLRYLERNQKTNKRSIFLYQEAVSIIKTLTRVYKGKQYKTKQEQELILKKLEEEIAEKTHIPWRKWFLSKIKDISL